MGGVNYADVSLSTIGGRSTLTMTTKIIKLGDYYVGLVIDILLGALKKLG